MDRHTKKIEKKCHAWIGVWWQIKEGKYILYKSKRKKDCINFLKLN